MLIGAFVKWGEFDFRDCFPLRVHLGMESYVVRSKLPRINVTFQFTILFFYLAICNIALSNLLYYNTHCAAR